MGTMLRERLRAQARAFVAFTRCLPEAPPDGETWGETWELWPGADPGPDKNRAARDTPDTRVMLDFTLPEALSETLAYCEAHAVPLVLGTTGLQPAHFRELKRASARIPILHARNFSVEMLLLQRYVAALAAFETHFYGTFHSDVEIVERHHRHKQDAPSGTALALGEAILRARAEAAAAVRRQEPPPAFSAPEALEALSPETPPLYHAPGGLGGLGGLGETAGSKERTSRPVGPVAYSAVRGGELVGEHTVHFMQARQELVFTHRAYDRAVFADGAIHAALWLHQASRQRDSHHGLFTLEDLIEDLGSGPGIG